MAFSNLHVVCGYAGGYGFNSSIQPLLARPMWSEDPPSGTPTTNVAVPLHDTNGAPIFRIRAAVDSWIAIGPLPNASTGIRFPVQAGVDYDLFATPGDKVAWIAA